MTKKRSTERKIKREKGYFRFLALCIFCTNAKHLFSSSYITNKFSILVCKLFEEIWIIIHIFIQIMHP